MTTDVVEEREDVVQCCWSDKCNGKKTKHRHYNHTTGGGGVIDILDCYECRECGKSGAYTL